MDAVEFIIKQFDYCYLYLEKGNELNSKGDNYHCLNVKIVHINVWGDFPSF